MRKMLFTSMAVALLVALAPVARAETIQINYQIGAMAPVNCTILLPGPVQCANMPGPPLDITVLGADSNSPGSNAPANSHVTSEINDLVNNSAITETLDITISANNFTAPAGSGLALTSHIGGTVVVPASGSNIQYQSCVDTSNTIETSFGINCPSGALASGISSPSITDGDFDDNQFATLPLVTPLPYSINERFVINLAPGAEINWSASSIVSNIPEPATVPLLGAGLVALAVLGRKRRILASK